MELLKTLKLTRYQRNNSNNPILQRRIKLAAGISEQIQLAENPTINSLMYVLLQTIVVNYVKLKWVNVYCVGGVWVLMAMCN